MKLSKLLIILNLGFGLIAPLSTQAAPQVVDQVAAIVNNNVILENDINEMLNTIKASMDPKNLPDDKTLRRQIIDRLIIENLILQKATQAKITVTDDEITQAINQIASENQMTIDELRSKLSMMKMSYNDYRDRIQNDMLIERAKMNEVRRRITISDNEVENLAKTIAKQPTNNIDVNIGHILIAVPENASGKQIADASNKARDIVARLEKGENFAKMAAAYSNDELALKGGNMGWHKINELPTIFESKLIRAPKGAIIGPIRSGVGLHILKVIDNRSEAPKVITAQEVHARHILIKTNVLMTDDKAKQKINEIRQSIINGSTSFELAAKAYSEDPGSADSGGDLGWSLPERYDPAFKNALLELKKGEISEPVKSSFGWHLIELIDSKKVDKTGDATKEQAYRIIFNRKFSEESQVWIQEIKGDAYIKIMDDDQDNQDNQDNQDSQKNQDNSDK